jgi:hypothetical protein
MTLSGILKRDHLNLPNIMPVASHPKWQFIVASNFVSFPCSGEIENIFGENQRLNRAQRKSATGCAYRLGFLGIIFGYILPITFFASRKIGDADLLK